MRVIVCGGRDYDNHNIMARVLDSLLVAPTLIIHGAASGADTLAKEWALSRSIPHKPYPADWGTYGRSAGPIRNKLMIADGKPDLVVAFLGGKGTADMVRRARKARIQTRLVTDTGAIDLAPENCLPFQCL